MIGWTVCEGKDEGEVWQERGLVRECERGVSWKKGHQCSRVGHVGDSKLAMFSSDISRERVRRAGWKTAASEGAGESGIVCKPLYMIWWSVTFGSPPNASSIICTTSSVVRCGLRGLTRSVSRNRNGRRGVRSRICFKKPCSTRTLLAIDGSLKKTMNTRSVGVAVYTYFL